jgi:SAM-dependent methyltransferase
MQPDEYRAMFDLEDRLWWYVGMRAITAAMIEESISENMRVLDTGCGTGYGLAWMKERFRTGEVFGVDVSGDAAVCWKERGLDTLAVASASKLPFGSDRFDLVTCFDVIYQFQSEQAKGALCEMQRVLKPGGMLLIREPAYNWMRGAHDLAIGTQHRFTRKELCSQVRDAGFAIRRATYANTLLFGAAAAHRLMSRLGGRASSDVKPVPSWMNRTFEVALRMEARMLRKISFPFGLSVIVTGQKQNRAI